MGAIEDDFAELAEMIQKQRASDVALDEICTDYEVLIADLQKVLVKQDNGKNRLQSDLQNSLDGLKHEILAKMREI